MLSESDELLSIKSDVFQEQKDSGQKVTQSFVVYNLLFYSLSDGNPFGLSHLVLKFSAVQWKLDVCNILKLFMALVLRINKMFDFRHLEFSYS